MKAGRESIRSLVATEVLKWEYIKDGLYRDHKGNQVFFNPLKDMNDAWRVVEKLQENDWEVIIETRSNETEVKAKGRMGGWIDTYGIAETAPLAICLAALKACGVIIDG